MLVLARCEEDEAMGEERRTISWDEEGERRVGMTSNTYLQEGVTTGLFECRTCSPA